MNTNAELVRDYVETVWNRGRTELAAKYLAEDLVQHNPQLPNGSAPLVAFVDGLRQQLPSGRFDIRRMAADGDLVFVHSLFTAADADAGTVVVDVFRVADGVITEHWDVREPVPPTTASGNDVI